MIVVLILAKMKVLLIMCCCAVTIINATLLTKDEKTKIHQYCTQKYNINHELTFMKGGEYMKNDPDYRCFTACILQNVGVFTPEGYPEYDVLIKTHRIGEDRAKLDRLYRCIDYNNQPNICDRIMETMSCIDDKFNKLF